MAAIQLTDLTKRYGDHLADVTVTRRTLRSYQPYLGWLLRLAVGLPLMGAGFGGYFFSPVVSVEALVDQEFDHLLTQYKRKRADRVISAMYESAERVKTAELNTAMAQADFDEDQREVMEAMADSIVSQLLAAPTKSLRDAAAEDDWDTIHTALELFDPDFGPEPPEFVEGMNIEDIPEGMRDEIPAAVLEQLADD